MAVVHRTTLTPGKLELISSWLPAQPWCPGSGREPELTMAGGFRLDDPQGEVGIEFAVVTDGSGDRPLTYQVPLTYRGAPLDGAGHALLGTTEHGVLGRRWVYDGTHDPVLVAQLFGLVVGEAEPQAQKVSDTPDPSVTGSFTGAGHPGAISPLAVTNGPYGTDLLVQTTAPGSARQLTIRVNRLLQAAPDDSSAAAPALGRVTAGWSQPDGTEARGVFAAVRDTTPGSAAG